MPHTDDHLLILGFESQLDNVHVRDTNRIAQGNEDHDQDQRSQLLNLTKLDPRNINGEKNSKEQLCFLFTHIIPTISSQLLAAGGKRV